MKAILKYDEEKNVYVITYGNISLEKRTYRDAYYIVNKLCDEGTILSIDNLVVPEHSRCEKAA